MKAQTARGDSPGQAAIDREDELYAWLNDKWRNLADVFGDELRLGTTISLSQRTESARCVKR